MLLLLAAITCLQMGPLVGYLSGWRTPWWICQLAPAPGLGEVERGRWSREVRDACRAPFYRVTARDGSRRGEQEEEGVLGEDNTL